MVEVVVMAAGAAAGAKAGAVVDVRGKRLKGWGFIIEDCNDVP